jgi:DNA invertase Pin-like site-specific DNA recombinase
MSIAEHERKRTALKLEHARKSGRKFGRPAKLNADQAALARWMKANGETAATICETLGIGRTTLYRYLAEGARTDALHAQLGNFSTSKRSSSQVTRSRHD